MHIEWRTMRWEEFQEIKNLVTGPSRVASLNKLFPKDCQETIADIRKNEEALQIVLGEIEEGYLALFKAVSPVENLYPQDMKSHFPFEQPTHESIYTFCQPTNRKSVIDTLEFVHSQAADRVTSWTAAGAWFDQLIQAIPFDSFDREELLLFDGKLFAYVDSMIWGKTEDGTLDMTPAYGKIPYSERDTLSRTPPDDFSKVKKVALESRELNSKK